MAAGLCMNFTKQIASVATILWTIFLLSIIVCKSEADHYYYKQRGSDEKIGHDQPFLKQEFFECGRAEGCSHVVKEKDSKEFSLVNGNHLLKEESEYDVVYKKIDVQQGWSPWASTACSRRCGGGNMTRVRHCLGDVSYCPGASSSQETCNNDVICPELTSCINNATASTQSDQKSFSLTNHTVNCQSSGLLRKFQLIKNSSAIRYDFACCKLQNLICNLINRTTIWNKDGLGNTVFLDRHTVDCGNYGFLHDFTLQRNATSSQIRYAYSCCDIPDPSWRSAVRCQEQHTEFTDDGGGNVFQLALHNVTCGAGSALSKFVLRRNALPHDSWKYIYNCCTVEP